MHHATAGQAVSTNVVAMLVLSCSLARAQPPAEPPPCRPAGLLVRLAGAPEASGLALSQAVPGRLWTHNDSGQPVLFALDTQGAITRRVTIPGAMVDDWEAVAVGPCPAGSCLFIGDIGDNEAERRQITIYRVAEPAASADSTAPAEALHATYPDGAHDAEALLVTPDGPLFVVTKGETGPVALYAFPRDLRPGATVRLEPVGEPRNRREARGGDRITDGAVSPDGQWVVLRTPGSVIFYRASELLAGTWREARRVDLGPLAEPQGEGVALSGDMLFLAGEGGGRRQPGTFARLTCGPRE